MTCISQPLTARVSAVHKERWQILTEGGECFARLKSSVYHGKDAAQPFPTVGDYVTYLPNESGDAIITATLPRRSYFSRLDPRTRQQAQAVAANFDTVFVMTSANQDFSAGRLERYLTESWQSGATPVVLVTKCDLTDEAESYLAQARRVCVGVEVLPISSVTGEGLSALSPYLAPGKTVVFLGSSGVGKSTLVNALMGREAMKTGAIREDDEEGRHTTTYRQLLALPDGAFVIDTPGMRELGMWDVSVGLDRAFAEIDALAEGCRFSDCTHRTEPGCAVLAALHSGELDEKRYRSYLRLGDQARYVDPRRALVLGKTIRRDRSRR